MKMNDYYFIGIDLGTTNLAFELIRKESGQVIHAVSSRNSQRAYGADVLSRIQAANEGNGRELQDRIRRDLLDGITRLLREAPAIKESSIVLEQVEQIAIAGNTAMGHLLMGYACESLGVAPFMPASLEIVSMNFEELFQEQIKANAVAENKDVIARKVVAKQSPCNAEVVLLPGISAFVGADIVAGLLFCGFDRLDKPCLFIDLGTNGEMALGNKEKILVTSVAAGPAFEGGGLHGSEAIETVYDLRQRQLIDETGMMVNEYTHSPENRIKESLLDVDSQEARLTQKAVRNLQLAKSAIRAGVETLLLRYGIGYNEVDQVFLAGGFGFHINIESVVGIGMLPKEFKDRTKVVGNSVLGGIKVFLTAYVDSQIGNLGLEQIITASSEIQLPLDSNFNRLFMEHMLF